MSVGYHLRILIVERLERHFSVRQVKLFIQMPPWPDVGVMTCTILWLLSLISVRLD